LKHHSHFLIPTQSPGTAVAFALAFAVALALDFAVAFAFLPVIPQKSASSVAVALAFLAVILSGAKNLLLARAASARFC
jgi:hypothetical protein